MRGGLSGQASRGGFGGVDGRIIAGDNIEVSPSTGVGDVTISALTSGGGTLSVTRTVASAAGADWDGQTVAGTATVTGVTNITGTDGFNAFVYEAPTITSASALTVTYAATVAIEGPPVAAGLATITNKYSLWIQSGKSRFDDTIIFTSAGATAFGRVDSAVNAIGIGVNGTPAGANFTKDDALRGALRLVYFATAVAGTSGLAVQVSEIGEAGYREPFSILVGGDTRFNMRAATSTVSAVFTDNATATTYGQLQAFGTGSAGADAARPGSIGLISDAAVTGGLSFAARNAAASIRSYVGGITAATERVRITATAHAVGNIAGTIPAGVFTVISEAGGVASVGLKATTASASAAVELASLTGFNGATAVTAISTYSGGATTSGDLVLSTTPAAGVLTERVRVTSAGAVNMLSSAASGCALNFRNNNGGTLDYAVTLYGRNASNTIIAGIEGGCFGAQADGHWTFGVNHSTNGYNGALQLLDTTTDDETALLIRKKTGGVFSLARVTQGAANSGAAGFRLLRVPNA